MVDLDVALARLHAQRPAGTVFAFAHGDIGFLGSTPERLVRLAAGRVGRSCCGSA